MEMTLLISIGLSLYFSMLVVGGWILTRMNLQVKRLQDSPTPRAAFEVLKDMQEAQDLRVLGLMRTAESIEAAHDDLLRQIRSIVARLNQESRKNNQLDTVALADYLQDQQQVQETPGAPETLSDVDRSTGEQIDYR